MINIARRKIKRENVVVVIGCGISEKCTNRSGFLRTDQNRDVSRSRLQCNRDAEPRWTRDPRRRRFYSADFQSTYPVRMQVRILTSFFRIRSIKDGLHKVRIM